MIDADATLPLQRAIVAALKADTTLTGYIAGRVYDQVAENAILPYISIGPIDVLTATAHGFDLDMYEGSTTSLQIDAWSGGPGSVEAKKIGRAIRSALHYKDLELENNQHLILLHVEQIRYLVDPDGLTQHAAVTVQALTEPKE